MPRDGEDVLQGPGELCARDVGAGVDRNPRAEQVLSAAEMCSSGMAITRRGVAPEHLGRDVRSVRTPPDGRDTSSITSSCAVRERLEALVRVTIGSTGAGRGPAARGPPEAVRRHGHDEHVHFGHASSRSPWRGGRRQLLAVEVVAVDVLVGELLGELGRRPEDRGRVARRERGHVVPQEPAPMTAMRVSLVNGLARRPRIRECSRGSARRKPRARPCRPRGSRSAPSLRLIASAGGAERAACAGWRRRPRDVDIVARRPPRRRSRRRRRRGHGGTKRVPLVPR